MTLLGASFGVRPVLDARVTTGDRILGGASYSVWSKSSTHSSICSKPCIQDPCVIRQNLVFPSHLIPARLSLACVASYNRCTKQTSQVSSAWAEKLEFSSSPLDDSMLGHRRKTGHEGGWICPRFGARNPNFLEQPLLLHVDRFTTQFSGFGCVTTQLLGPRCRVSNRSPRWFGKDPRRSHRIAGPVKSYAGGCFFPPHQLHPRRLGQRPSTVLSLTMASQLRSFGLLRSRGCLVEGMGEVLTLVFR